MPFRSPGDAQDLLAHVKRAFERRDVDAALELFAPDAELRPDPFEPALAGANAIRERCNAFAASFVHTEFDAERTWAAGSSVLASWHGAGTRATTAERIRWRGFLQFDLEAGGLVTRCKAWTHERVVGIDSTHRPTG